MRERSAARLLIMSGFIGDSDSPREKDTGGDSLKD